MDVTKINEVNCLTGILPVKKMNELEFNREYKINGIKAITTEYGTRIVANINDEFNIYLPSRTTQHLKDDNFMKSLNELIDSNYLFLRYHGGKYNKFEFINSSLDVKMTSGII
ncbi:uncharacterized protein LOC141525502 [Cotesia typhae]|uniref:uncharacterized protein LOC141525501 n=1 Tax=Cotesia typhae TaxID=2053667 RepID=UPI003D6932EC